jgi:hypothetical protein
MNNRKKVIAILSILLSIILFIGIILTMRTSINYQDICFAPLFLFLSMVIFYVNLHRILFSRIEIGHSGIKYSDIAYEYSTTWSNVDRIDGRNYLWHYVNIYLREVPDHYKFIKYLAPLGFDKKIIPLSDFGDELMHDKIEEIFKLYKPSLLIVELKK